MGQIQSISGEVYEWPENYCPRSRLFGRPPVLELTIEELRYNVILIENYLTECNEQIRYLLEHIPDNIPLPKGLGYWDGITKAENEKEAERRRNAKV